VKGPVVLFETLFAELSDGWAIAARAYARAMKLAGVDVRLHSWAGIVGDQAPEVLAEVEGMLRPCEQGKWDLYVFSTPLGSPELMQHPFWELLRFPKPRAFYTMFERSSVQGALVDSLNELEGVMVPCSQNQRVIAESGCKNATWVPFPYFDSDPHLKLSPPKYEPRAFYWIGRWEPRKAPDNLIRAFLRAFKPGEAELVLKIGPSPWHRPFPSAEEVIATECDKGDVRRNGWDMEKVKEAIEVIRAKYSPEEMLALHARSDVYVSASRGEGLDLPSFAAKLAGRRVVTTDSGGPFDFLAEDDICVPAEGTVAATDYEHFWGRGTRYNDYDLQNLVHAMQVARAEPRVPRSRMPDRHRAENIGKELLNWIEGCRGRQ